MTFKNVVPIFWPHVSITFISTTYLHRHCFCPGQTERTADLAHPTQVLEPSAYWSLHWRRRAPGAVEVVRFLVKAFVLSKALT